MQLELAKGTVASGGEDIYWELTSEGADDARPVVLLSHGAGGTHAVWYQQLHALGQSFRVLTWDSRGFGNSTNRGDAPSAEAGADDIAAVLDVHGVDRAHLVGQSMGGWYISAFAVGRPDRVQSLVYADTIGGLWTPALREAMVKFWAGGGLTPDGPEFLGGHPALWPGTAERDPSHAFLYQALGSFHSPPMDKLGAIIEWTVSHRTIASLGVPVLFVAGEHDQIFPAALLEESAAMIAGAMFEGIEAAGHSPYFEQPEHWNSIVRSFLTSA